MPSKHLDIQIPFTINVNMQTKEQEIKFDVHEIELFKAFLKSSSLEQCAILRTAFGPRIDDDEFLKKEWLLKMPPSDYDNFSALAWEFCVKNAFSQATRPFKVCNFCYAQAHRRCSTCKKVYYCSKACQLIDWKSQHRKICRTTPTTSSHSSSSKANCFLGLTFRYTV